jgi:hypothetical protein
MKKIQPFPDMWLEENGGVFTWPLQFAIKPHQ